MAAGLTKAGTAATIGRRCWPSICIGTKSKTGATTCANGLACNRRPPSRSGFVSRNSRRCRSPANTDCPIEFALVHGGGPGWRAATPGEQSARIHFDEPQSIGLIQLRFDETEHQRVQEFWLRWSDDRGRTFQPIVRQQFSFSPPGATQEVENYNFSLKGATELELHIVADVSNAGRVAALTSLRLR
jgi:hypothetical protein